MLDRFPRPGSGCLCGREISGIGFDVMSISSRFVVQSTIALLVVGFLTLLGIVGMTIWLGERAQIYFNEVIEARDTRASAVELRNAVQTRGGEPARLPAHRQRDLSRSLRHARRRRRRGNSTR